MTIISDEVITAYALENAIKYGGKASQGAILSGLFAEGLEKSEIPKFIPRIKKILDKVNSFPPTKQASDFEKVKDLVSKREVREGLPDLPYAVKGSVVMRFPPFPSGPLHIGNTRTLILNDEYVKKYGGKLILMMDDTIGSEKKPIEKGAYKMIEEGVKWLGVNFDKKIIKKSDRLEKYYAYAEELIRKGYMYVCNCPIEVLRQNKVDEKECSCRQFTQIEQLQRWDQMFLAEEGSMCVRLKTSMQDPDPAFRDRIMFRISDRPHALLGNKYRVYPLLDFSSAIDDHLLGITHILRGMDLVMETRVEKFIWDIFGWDHPEVIYNGFFTVKGIKLSKSKGAEEVKNKTYKGWNDPRIWSLQSLRDRGFRPEAIREFIIGMGLKKTNITIPIEVLYTLNKKHLENVPRYFFVESPVKIKINGCPEIQAKLPLHPNGKLGTREYKTNQEFLISDLDYQIFKNKNYRLMHLLNFKTDNILKTLPVTHSFLGEKPNPSLQTKFLHWLPANVNNIDVDIVMPNGEIKRGLGESELKKLKEGTIIQFERFGFVRLYKKHKDKLEFWFTHL